MAVILVSPPLLAPGLLGVEQCCDLLRQAVEAETRRSIYLRTDDADRDPTSRQSDEVILPDKALTALRDAISRHLPAVGDHFAAADLEVVQSARVLRYGVGDFIMQHRDEGDVESGSRTVRRTVSFSVLLSDPADFAGGDLIGYGVHHTPGFERLGKVLRLGQGDAVFFESRMLHEVTPVTSGVRLSAIGHLGHPKG